MADTSPTDEALSEYADLEAQLADPAVHADQGRARELGRRYAELGPLVAAINEAETVEGDLAAAREFASEDPSFAAEVPELEKQLAVVLSRIRDLLIPVDPIDAKDVILEVKGGDIRVDVCAMCHPFYTGKQKILDTGGRVARFEQRFGKRTTA